MKNDPNSAINKINQLQSVTNNNSIHYNKKNLGLFPINKKSRNVRFAYKAN